MAYIGRSVDIGMFEKQVLTPDSSTTTFTLTFAVGSANSLLVVYGGVIQEPAVAYSVSGGGQSIVFSEAPVTGHSLYVIYLGKQLTTPRAAGQETTKQTFTGDGTTTLFTLTDPPVVPAGIMVFVDGILQREGSGNNYVSSGSTINFSAAPDSGAEIDVYTLVKEKVSIDTVADGSITRAKMAQSFPYWDASGKVGINTPTPTRLLHITGAGASGVNAANPSIRLDNTATGRFGLVELSSDANMYIWNADAGAGSTVFMRGAGSGTESARIDANGRVGIGSQTPTSKLTISTTGADGIELTTDAGSGGGLSNRLFFTHGGGAGTGVALVGANSRTEGVLRFNTGSTPGSTSGTQRLEFSRTGIGLGVVSPVDGIGIAFPGSQSASSDPNTLDDYEEGTWTPILQGGGADPTGVSYATQRGVYTKIGNMVYISWYLSFTTFTGGTGSFLVGGFPFTIKSTCDANGAFKIENITLDAGRTYVVSTAVGGTTYATVHQCGSNTTWIGLTLGSNVTSSGTTKYCTGALAYQVA